VSGRIKDRLHFARELEGKSTDSTKSAAQTARPFSQKLSGFPKKEQRAESPAIIGKLERMAMGSSEQAGLRKSRQHSTKENSTNAWPPFFSRSFPQVLPVAQGLTNGRGNGSKKEKRDRTASKKSLSWRATLSFRDHFNRFSLLP